jgi:hypothetical protein
MTQKLAEPFDENATPPRPTRPAAPKRKAKPERPAA